jgi:acyl carrier protein
MRKGVEGSPRRGGKSEPESRSPPATSAIASARDTTMNDHDRSSVAAKVIASLSAALPAALKGTRITEESLLREDLGLDSLGTVDLVIQLEEEFEISIETEDLTSLRTVGDLILLIEKKANRGTGS